MFRKLFLNRKVGIIDGDNRLDACNEVVLKDRLQNMITGGMQVRGIQVFHYAGLHYNTRWNNYPARFLNALLNSASSISNNGTYFNLNSSEEAELQSGSSEVLGIGLSNMFMCRWYGVNINRIEKILGSGKRCDYRFPYNDQVIIFESKGRSNASQISSALKDCVLKKQNYVSDLKYSTIVHLPRDGSPTSLYLYDPLVDHGFINFDEEYLIAKHYARVSNLSGLTGLAEAIKKRIIRYEETGVWETSSLTTSNVMKIGLSIQIGNDSFWTRRNIQKLEYNDVSYYVQFGLHERIIDLLNNWNIDELSRFTLEDIIIDNHNFSILSDGSLFYVGNDQLE